MWQHGLIFPIIMWQHGLIFPHNVATWAHFFQNKPFVPLATPLFFVPRMLNFTPKKNSQVIGLLFVARKSIEKFHQFPLSMVHLVLIFFIVRKESCTYMKFIFQGQTEAPQHFLLQFSVQRSTSGTQFAPLWAPLLKDSIAPKKWRESHHEN
jgi:hypothetical protein